MGEAGVHNLRNRSEYLSAIEDPSLMVIDCFATWCNPCKAVAPKIVEMAKEDTKTRFYKLDVDEVTDVAQELGVRAMPTFYILRKSEKIDEVVGTDLKKLRDKIAYWSSDS